MVVTGAERRASQPGQRSAHLLRRQLGAVLRRRREVQHRTLRDVAAGAGVSLGYLSEVERGVKEASSELLSAICRALDLGLADLLVEVADALYLLDVATHGVASAQSIGLVPVADVPSSAELAHTADAPRCGPARAA